MKITRFDTEGAARALALLLDTGRIDPARNGGWYTDDLWDLGLLYNVDWWEAHTTITYDHTGHPRYGFRVSERGNRYISHYGV